MAMRTRAALAVLVISIGALTGCGGGDRGAPGGDVSGDRGSAYEGRPGGEVRTEEDAQSTFALDVDTASYGFARRVIDDGRRPDPADIRPEEFVNSFAQNYRQPTGNGFAIHADGLRWPGGRDDTRLLRIGLQTRAADTETRPDAALTFVVDVSGSMAEPGRLDLVQDALHTLVDELRPTDTVAIVAFSEQARVVRRPTRVADAAGLHDAIDDLRTQRSTNLEAGLVLGYDVARAGFREDRTNRVIILSDGLANVGNTDATPILRRIRDEADKEIGLLGVGVGSEYGDALMEQLADRGDGFVVYVSERAQAREVFVSQLPSTLAIRALDAKVQVTFDPSTVRSYRLVGYENRDVADEDFRNDRVDGGEIGPGHSVTALYEIRLEDGAEDRRAPAARVQVRWLDPLTREPAESHETVLLAALDGDLESAAPSLRVSYAAAYFAESLRGADAPPLRELAAVARSAYRETSDPEVRDLAALIERAAELD